MKTSNPPAPAALHRFFVPAHAPFLELRTTLHSALPYAAHFHSAFSLGLILQGTTRFALNGVAHLAEQGDIVLIPPGRPHSCNPVHGPRGYHMLLIDADWLQERVGDRLGACAPCIRDPALFRAAEAVVEAICADHEGAAVELEGLLHRLARYHAALPADAPATSALEGSPPGNGHDGHLEVCPPAFCPALTYPHDPPDLPPTVSALAREAGVRRESFSRAVRRQTGLPPSRYLHCLRLEKARWLLRQGKSIAEAALAAGYADQSHFHRMFVRFCAVTPGRYRQALSHPYKK